MIPEIEKDTFVNADEKTRHALTYDMLYGISKGLAELNTIYSAHLGHCENRFKDLEKAKRRDFTATSVFGFFGGFVAIIVAKFFGK